jgi:hypothetical protein
MGRGVASQNPRNYCLLASVFSGLRWKRLPLSACYCRLLADSEPGELRRASRHPFVYGPNPTRTLVANGRDLPSTHLLDRGRLLLHGIYNLEIRRNGGVIKHRMEQTCIRWIFAGVCRTRLFEIRHVDRAIELQPS